MTASTFVFCGQCGAANSQQTTACSLCSHPLDVSSNPGTGPGRPASTNQQVFATASMSLLNDCYTLVRSIGQGGYGTVYLAYHQDRPDQPLAIKQITIRGLSVQEAIAATDTYNREVALLSRLTHPRLPQVHDSFTDAENWYLVMDYIEGETLEAMMQKRSDKPLPIKKVINIGLQLCNLLGYLHTQNPPIIFRDLKPANIMLNKRGRVFLIDFGIARLSQGFLPDTGPLGTPGYAAPEQYGRNARTTPRTDIYGLGATLRMLLTGQDPLEQISGNAPAYKSRSVELDILLAQMLEQDERKRPQSPSDVRKYLKSIHVGWKRVFFAYAQGLLLGFLCCTPFFTSGGFFPLMLVPLAVSLLFFLVPNKRLVALGTLTIALPIILLLILAFLKQTP